MMAVRPVESVEELATSVARRSAELLCTRVHVIDDWGRVLSTEQPEDVTREDAAADGACIEVPVRLEGRSWTVRIAEPGNGEVISHRLARAIVEEAVSQSAVIERLPDQADLRNKFIFDLLRGTAGDEADILREAQILGMSFARPRAVILIDASRYITEQGPHPDAQPDTRDRGAMRAQHVIASVVSYFTLPSSTICAYIGGGEVAVLKATSVQDLMAWAETGNGAERNPSWSDLGALKRASLGLVERLRKDTATPVSAGIGRYHPGVPGLAQSYQDAAAALSLGRRYRGDALVHCLDELGVAAFAGVSDERTKIDLASQLLSPLDGEPDLIETVTVLFDENCCPSLAAQRLKIHRNTLSYRLEKIASLIGLDPRRFDDAVQIRLACILRSA